MRGRRFSNGVHLAADLGAAEDRHEGRLRLAEEPAEGGDLLHDESPSRLALQKLRHAGYRGMCPVHRAEGVGHIDVSQCREGGGEARLVGGLGVVVAEILQQTDLAGAERCAGGASLPAHTIAGKEHLPAEELGESRGNRPETEFRFGLALRTAAVRDQQKSRAGVGELSQRRQGGLEPGGVGNSTFGQRHIEIDAHENANALERGEIEIFQCEQ